MEYGYIPGITIEETPGAVRLVPAKRSGRAIPAGQIMFEHKAPNPEEIIDTVLPIIRNARYQDHADVYTIPTDKLSNLISSIIQYQSALSAIEDHRQSRRCDEDYDEEQPLMSRYTARLSHALVPGQHVRHSIMGDTWIATWNGSSLIRDNESFSSPTDFIYGHREHLGLSCDYKVGGSWKVCQTKVNGKWISLVAAELRKRRLDKKRTK